MNDITQRLHIDEHILAALKEDIPREDISTNALMAQEAPAVKPTPARVELLCKEDGIIAGLSVFSRVFELLDSTSAFESFIQDGDTVKAGQVLAVLTGDVRALLAGERTALNYLQHMSGIASATARMRAALEGSHTKLLDTRKTIPGMRLLEKYAVKVGGGENHRYNLSDCLMLKDNHIAAAGGVKSAIKQARAYASPVTKIEVEVENLTMLQEALAAGADIIMLDNMSIPQMKEAVRITQGRALLECSGKVTQKNIKALASTGVDYLSSGALTHSAPALDLSLKNLTLL